MKGEGNKDNDRVRVEDLGIEFTKDKIELARLKNVDLAKKKLGFTFAATIITLLTIHYSDINQLLMLTVIFFVVPTYFDTITMDKENIVVKTLVIIYKCIFWILNAIILIEFAWFIFDKADALHWTSCFFKVILYFSVTKNFIFSLVTFLNLSNNMKEHIALVVLSQTSKEKIKERLIFQERQKENAAEENREFIRNKSRRGGKR
ncbi:MULTISPECIES: hypothetical protein [Bacillati]|uniref:hypothetical protein n=1 Tax=Bacillati TaxID=1783272 RepID=UPI00138E062B